MANDKAPTSKTSGEKPARPRMTTFASFTHAHDAALANALRVHLGIRHDQIHEPIDEQRLADGLRTLTS